MREMTGADLARIRRAVQLRDRCNDAAVAAGERLGFPLSPEQANVAYDAMVDLIRAHDREGGTAHANS